MRVCDVDATAAATAPIDVPGRSVARCGSSDCRRRSPRPSPPCAAASAAAGHGRVSGVLAGGPGGAIGGRRLGRARRVLHRRCGRGPRRRGGDCPLDRSRRCRRRRCRLLSRPVCAVPQGHRRQRRSPPTRASSCSARSRAAGRDGRAAWRARRCRATCRTTTRRRGTTMCGWWRWRGCALETVPSIQVDWVALRSEARAGGADVRRRRPRRRLAVDDERRRAGGARRSRRSGATSRPPASTPVERDGRVRTARANEARSARRGVVPQHQAARARPRGPSRSASTSASTCPSSCAALLHAGTGRPRLDSRRSSTSAATTASCRAWRSVRTGRSRRWRSSPACRSTRSRTLALDTSSRTSVALTRILCAQHCAASRRRSSPHGPDLAAMLDAADAALVIGDPALRRRRRSAGPAEDRPRRASGRR